MRRWFLSRRLIRAGALTLCALALSLAACAQSLSSSHAPTQTALLPTAAQPTPTPTAPPVSIVLTSPAFRSGEAIPSTYTCDGENISPPLAWSNAPQHVSAFILLMDDLSGDVIHWVLFNVPAETRNLPPNTPPGDQLPSGARQGTNDLGAVGYKGPCPLLPKGATDTYLFTIYALDAMLAVDAGATEQVVLDAARGHVLSLGRLTGTYMLRQQP
jgi:Raf kinase inhibitor-like YbhB/YbcL family protein